MRELTPSGTMSTRSQAWMPLPTSVPRAKPATESPAAFPAGTTPFQQGPETRNMKLSKECCIGKNVATAYDMTYISFMARGYWTRSNDSFICSMVTHTSNGTSFHPRMND